MGILPTVCKLNTVNGKMERKADWKLKPETWEDDVLDPYEHFKSLLLDKDGDPSPTGYLALRRIVDELADRAIFLQELAHSRMEEAGIEIKEMVKLVFTDAVPPEVYPSGSFIGTHAEANEVIRTVLEGVELDTDEDLIEIRGSCWKVSLRGQPEKAAIYSMNEQQDGPYPDWMENRKGSILSAIQTQEEATSIDGRRTMMRFFLWMYEATGHAGPWPRSLSKEETGARMGNTRTSYSGRCLAYLRAAWKLRDKTYDTDAVSHYFEDIARLSPKSNGEYPTWNAVAESAINHGLFERNSGMTLEQVRRNFEREAAKLFDTGNGRVRG